MNRTASTTAELMVAACIVLLGVVMFAPTANDASVTHHPLMLLGGILAVGGVFVGIASEWRIKRLVFAWPLYIVLTVGVTIFTLTIYYPRYMSCAETLLR